MENLEDALKLLSQQQLEALDDLIVNNGMIPCIKFIMECVSCGIHEAQYIIFQREQQIGYLRTHEIILPSFDDILIRCHELSPVALEANWDGDTQGWIVYLEAVVEIRDHKQKYSLICLGSRRGAGGDMRLFNGQDISIDAQDVNKLGQLLSTELDIPFYFPSPFRP